MKGILHLDDWAGRRRVPVEVVGETPKRYRVRVLEDCGLPSRRRARSGDVVLVPRYAVTLVGVVADGTK